MELLQILQLGLLAVISFIQNMAFTASSRSRNSGDPIYHLKIAILSNGIWFICHMLIWKQIWGALTTGNYLSLIITGFVYVVFTSAGSSYMMYIMLKNEKGKRKVGASNEK